MRLRKLIKGFKPLCWKGSALYGTFGGKIVSTENLGESFETAGKIDYSGAPLGALLAHVEPLRRLTRTDAHKMRVLDSGEVFFLNRGGVHVLRPGCKKSSLSCAQTRGSRPLSLELDARGCIYFGEYHSNPGLGPVSIFKSCDGGLTWKAAYTFPSGGVRHVHGIHYDAHEDCLWICTGDTGAQAKLLKAACDFSSVVEIACGGQENRFVDVRTDAKRLYTVNDSPNADNFIRVYDKRSGAFENAGRIQNSCFFMEMAGGRFFCSTNSEMPEPHREISSSAPNDYKKVHLWELAEGGTPRMLASLKTDTYVRLAQLAPRFQYLFSLSNISFPEGKSPFADTLVAYCNGTSPYGGCCAVWEIGEAKSLTGAPERCKTAE